jgi:Flp pilus assembly protein TadD
MLSPERTAGSWKKPDSYDLSKHLRRGQNVVAVEVYNTNGPPALWCRISMPGKTVVSDETWEASYDGAAVKAGRLASKPKVVPPGSRISGGEEPLGCLRKRWGILAIFGAMAGGLSWWASSWSRRFPSRLRAGWFADAWPVLAFGAAWVALFANNLPVLPDMFGYDVDGHMQYVAYIQAHKTLPTAVQGWEMFQPPLYYMISASLLELSSFSMNEPGGVVVLRCFGLLVGVCHFTLVWASLRLLFPGEASRQRWGLLVAACLPPLIYLSFYVTNEGLAALFVTASLYVCLRLLRQSPAKWGTWALQGLCLGLALLTKSTAVLTLLVILATLAWKGWSSPEPLGSTVSLTGRTESGDRLARRPSEGPVAVHLWARKFGAFMSSRWARGMGLACGVCAVVCGWHYARVWLNFGNPLIGVWDPKTGFAWWQDEGYRTSVFYTRFGESFRCPWFSSTKSFGDGIYSTLWGEGLLGGGVDLYYRPPWNYELMALGYVLSLLPSLGLLAGGCLALARFIRQPSFEWFLMLGTCFAVLLGIVQMSLAAPYYCAVKAFYGLCALVPICALVALGTDLLSRWWREWRLLAATLAGMWAINSFVSFWIVHGTVPTVIAAAKSLARAGATEEAERLITQRLQIEPKCGEVRRLYASMLLDRGRAEEAAAEAKLVLKNNESDAIGNWVLATALANMAQQGDALVHARRATELAPGFAPAWQVLAMVLLEQRQQAEAMRVAREGLGVSAFSPELRFALGCALAEGAHLAEAVGQLRLAVALKPSWVDAHTKLGAALSSQGKKAEAVAEFAKALDLDASSPEALNDLAWIRATSQGKEFRNGTEALRLAERACTLTEYKEPVMMGTLAAALAEAGRFEEAAEMARNARALALAAGNENLADKNRRLIELFDAKKAYSEEP